MKKSLLSLSMIALFAFPAINVSATTIPSPENPGGPVIPIIYPDPDRVPVPGDGEADIRVKVWADINKNGILENSERDYKLVPTETRKNLSVSLIDVKTGDVVGTAKPTIESNGVVKFKNVYNSKWQIRINGKGLNFTKPNMVINEGRDSDIDSKTSLSNSIKVEGFSDRTLTAGLLVK